MAQSNQDYQRRLGCELGPRPMGSEAIGQARRLLAEAWAGRGAHMIHEERVLGSTWLARPPVVTVGDRSVDCLDCLPVPAAEVRGKAIDLRAGQTVEEGAIGIMSPAQTEAGLVTEWHLQGLVGALVASEVLPDRPQLFYFYEHVPFPVAGIAGERVGELMGEEVTLRTEGGAAATTCANLVADIGPDTADHLILGAHLDSHHIAPGVFDNLSGIFSLCGVLQELAPLRDHFLRRLRVIAYTGEEYSHQGSHRYVAEHAEDLASCRLAINFDSLCESTARGIAVIGCPQWVEPLRRHAGADIDVRDFFCIGSDYLPFVLQGIPAVRPADFHRALPPWTHYRDDTWTHHAPREIQANVDVWTPLLRHLLMTDELPPVEHRSAAAVAQEVAAHGWTELLARKLTYQSSVRKGEAGSPSRL